MRVKAGLAAAALLLTGSIIGWSAATGFPADAAPAPGLTTVADGGEDRTLGASVDSYAAVVERVAPAVVTVRSERRIRTSVRSPFQNDPRFREFFGDRFGTPDPQPRRQEGLGSGVIVRSDGYLLTNHHVVDGATQVEVELNDGRTFEAQVVGSDAPSDLAVLKIDGTNLTTLPLGDSDAVRIGDIALAVGNPLGIGQTVTMGIVSAKGRATGLGDGGFEDFIQTDAPINRGNSGGALVSTRGELIGINSQILSPSGLNIGIGFAIPANMAKHVMTQLIEHGEVRRGMLGVTVQPVTSETARELGLKQIGGALVASVEAGSPAERAGLKKGDVIVGINGTDVKDGNELRNAVSQLLPGTNTTVVVVRDGREQRVDVRLAELRANN
jgi:Do/DeqQ family serine protease